MKISHIQPPAPRRIRPMQIAMAACAAVAAVSLLSFYVQLVNQSVERGEHLRYEQQSSAAPSRSEPKAIIATFGADARPFFVRRGSAISAVASSETAVRE
jgi:hypothetical protein